MAGGGRTVKAFLRLIEIEKGKCTEELMERGICEPKKKKKADNLWRRNIVAVKLSTFNDRKEIRTRAAGGV